MSAAGTIAWLRDGAGKDGPYCSLRALDADWHQRWMRGMQYEIDEAARHQTGETVDKTIAAIANGISHEADDEGITGFMYGFAASVIARVWEHGEAFRQWFNTHNQIRDEGVKANESGGILNPALLVLSDKEPT